ncbi:hypothetical protein ACNKHT_02390 [Shigella flexneri]
MERKICARDNPSGGQERDGTLVATTTSSRQGEIRPVRDDNLFAAAMGITGGMSKKFMPPSSAFRFWDSCFSSSFVQCIILQSGCAKGHTAEAKSGNGKVGFS